MIHEKGALLGGFVCLLMVLFRYFYLWTVEGVLDNFLMWTLITTTLVSVISSIIYKKKSEKEKDENHE